MSTCSNVQRWIKNIFKNHWKTEWARNERLFLRKIKANTERFEDLKSLKEQRILSRLRTGHCRVSHKYDGGSFHADCDICGIRNSVEHFVCVCPQYESLRTLYGINGSIRDILSDDPSRAAALFCFLKDAGLYYEI